MTDNHPYWVEGRGWVEVAELKPGFELTTESGAAVRILRVHNTGHVERTYNLEVEDFHTFFVGSKHVLVHNACSTGKGSYAHIPDGPKVGPAKAYTASQKSKILAANAEKNGGVLKSDKSGTVLWNRRERLDAERMCTVRD